MTEPTEKRQEKDFARIYNDVDHYPTLADVAATLGISCKSVSNRASEYRRSRRLGADLPELLRRNGHTRPTVPLSEHENKFKDWSEAQCVEELLRIQALDEEKELTRNHFRNHSVISDSVWSRHFGSFEEFKRQAGITLSRPQRAMERAIAKHVSVDHYRRLGDERSDYGERYLRENPTRFKTALICSDLHDIEIDPFYLRVLLDTAQRAQPDVIVLVGDIFDLPEFGKYAVDPREWDVVRRIQFAHDKILGPLRAACPNGQIDLIEGNHENRIIKHLADATPALRAVLSDLHGWTVGRLLGLDQFEINYIAKADLSAFTKREAERELANNYKVYWDSLLCHHFPYARNMGLPGVNGHHHRHVVWSQFSPTHGAYEWHQLGAGHRRSASYTEGEKWHNGFALANVDAQSRSVSFDYVPVTDFAVSGGKWYHRKDDERY